MAHQQEQDAIHVPEPSSIPLQLLQELWRQASEESSQPNILLEQWIQEVRSWAKRAGWRPEFAQGFRAKESLWLPNLSEAHLQLLLALAHLADALGCSASQVTQVMLTSAKPDSSLATHEPAVDYRPLVDTLTHWQAIFELALDQAALLLDKEQFPAEALSASLAEMCDLLRAAFAQASLREGISYE